MQLAAVEITEADVEWARRIASSERARRGLQPRHADDLESAALLGLVQAAANYDPGRGASFRGHAGRRVRGAVLDEMRNIGREAFVGVANMVRRGEYPEVLPLIDELAMALPGVGYADREAQRVRLGAVDAVRRAAAGMRTDHLMSLWWGYRLGGPAPLCGWTAHQSRVLIEDALAMLRERLEAAGFDHEETDIDG